MLQPKFHWVDATWPFILRHSLTKAMFALIGVFWLAYPLLSASRIDSGSSFLLVSGSRKHRPPLMMERLPKIIVGIAGWYIPNRLTSGDTKPPILLTMETRPEAVCLKPVTHLVRKKHVLPFKLDIKNHRKDVGNSSWRYTEHTDPDQFKKIRPAATNVVTVTA